MQRARHSPFGVDLRENTGGKALQLYARHSACGCQGNIRIIVGFTKLFSV